MPGSRKKRVRSLKPGQYVCESYGKRFRFGSKEYKEAMERKGVVDIVWSIADTYPDNKTGEVKDAR